MKAGDIVCDIGMLDIPGTILTAGEQVSLVRWVIYADTFVSNDKLVAWDSPRHQELRKYYPENIWHKPKIARDPMTGLTLDEAFPNEEWDTPVTAKVAPELTIASAPKEAPQVFRVSPVNLMDLFNPEVPDDA